MGWVGGWLDTDDKTISVQLNLTGTELGNRAKTQHNWGFGLAELGNIYWPHPPQRRVGVRPNS